MKGRELVEALSRKLGEKQSHRPLTRINLAKRIGVSPMGVWNWENRRRSITPRQVANIVESAMKAERRHAESEVIKPIVEFFDLSPADSVSGKRVELFSQEDAKKHPYLRGLKDELQRNHGVYIFYDSRGRALYAGKALRTCLWDEIKNAFNRDRGVQKIRRVSHPANRVEFRNSQEQRRQIYVQQVALHELAFYLSAYVVPATLINTLEALLVRGFANDLSNIRMENFSKLIQRKKRRSKRSTSRG